MKGQRWGLGWVCIVGIAGLVACAPVSPSAPTSPARSMPPTVTASRPSPTVLPTPTAALTREPYPTPQTIEAAIDTLQRALNERDPTRLQPLLGSEILLDD